MNKGNLGGRALGRTRHGHVAEVLIFTRAVVANTTCNFEAAKLLVGIDLVTERQRAIPALHFTRIVGMEAIALEVLEHTFIWFESCAARRCGFDL